MPVLRFPAILQLLPAQPHKSKPSNRVSTPIERLQKKIQEKSHLSQPTNQSTNLPGFPPPYPPPALLSRSPPRLLILPKVRLIRNLAHPRAIRTTLSMRNPPNNHHIKRLRPVTRHRRSPAEVEFRIAVCTERRRPQFRRADPTPVASRRRSGTIASPANDQTATGLHRRTRIRHGRVVEAQVRARGRGERSERRCQVVGRGDAVRAEAHDGPAGEEQRDALYGMGAPKGSVVERIDPEASVADRSFRLLVIEDAVRPRPHAARAAAAVVVGRLRWACRLRERPDREARGVVRVPARITEPFRRRNSAAAAITIQQHPQLPPFQRPDIPRLDRQHLGPPPRTLVVAEHSRDLHAHLEAYMPARVSQ